MNGKKVSMLFPKMELERASIPMIFPNSLNDYFRKKGVQVLAGEQVAGLSSQGDRYVLKTSSGRELISAGVIAGIGLELNLELANAAGLQVGNGIPVDEYLLTNFPNVYAAGDVAEFYNPALHKRIRLEHEDNAVSMGRQAGRNMAGASEPYDYLPYFYSDLFELGVRGGG